MKRLIPILCVTLSLTACSGPDSSGGVALSKDPYPTNAEFPHGACWPTDPPDFGTYNSGCGWMYHEDQKYYIKPGADLSGAELYGAYLSGANLQYANLENTQLNWANLTGAILTYAKLRSTNLNSADLSRADLRNADLFNANLMWTNLTGAALEHADLYRCITGDGTIWPDGTRGSERLIDNNPYTPYWGCRWY